MKNKVIYWVCFQLLLLASCTTKSPPEEHKTVHVRTTSPKELYQDAKRLNPGQTDSIYRGIFEALIDSNKFPAIREHLSYYKQLKSNNPASTALDNRISAWVLNADSKFDSSNVLFSNALSLYKAIDDTAGITDSYFGIGVNNMYLGKYDPMFAHFLKALKYAGDSGDSAKYFNVNVTLANGYFSSNQLDKALAKVRASMNYYYRTHDQDAIAYCHSLISRVYYRKGDFLKSIDYSNQALEYRRSVRDTAAISASLNNIAACYMGLEQWDKALSGFEESLVLLREMEYQREEPIVEYNIARCLWKTGRFQEAESSLLRLITEAKKRNELPLIVAAYKLLSDMHSEQHQYDNAYRYLGEHKKYSDLVFDKEKTKITDELIVKYETVQKEARIKQLSIEQREDRIKKWLYLSLLTVTLLTGGILVFFFRARSRTSRLKLEQAQLELKTNTEALQQFTEHIIRKNNQIEQLENSLRMNRESVDLVINKEQNQEQLSELYRLKILTEEDWQNFKMLFDKVYPGFITTLRERFPDIAPSEERQSLLIKLNVSNRECAAMLGISADSVKKSRYRLKKRFDLDETLELDDFVKTI